jgi:hypothetical protein
MGSDTYALRAVSGQKWIIVSNPGEGELGKPAAKFPPLLLATGRGGEVTKIFA